jgi:hypothetical protein
MRTYTDSSWLRVALALVAGCLGACSRLSDDKGDPDTVQLDAGDGIDSAVCMGDVTISTIDDLAYYHHCQEIRGDLIFSPKFADLTVTDLPFLKNVTGSVRLTGPSGSSLVHFNLSSVQTIGGGLSFGEIANLVDVQLPALTTLGTAAAPSSSQLGTFLAECIRMPSLTQVYGDLNIGLDDRLATIDLAKLETVTGAFTLGGMPHLTSIDIHALTSAGSLSLSALPRMPYATFSRLNSTSVVSGTISLSDIGCCLPGNEQKLNCDERYTCN